MLILVPCPECSLPAEVTDRFSLTGTDGPVEHLAPRCSARHHFRMPTGLLPAESREWLRRGSHSGQDAATAEARGLGVRDLHRLPCRSREVELGAA
jgi:hypothetical protein